MFAIRRLDPTHLTLLLESQEAIYDALEDGSIFQRSSSEFIAYCLGSGGLCYGVFCDGPMVAYRIVYFPDGRDFDLSKETQLPAAERQGVAHWDTIAVLPPWRGYGLARLLNAHALSDLHGTRARHLFATSSPKNPHGIRSLLEAGFFPIRLIEKFGGKLRLLFYRQFPETPAASDGQGEGRRLALEDVDGLREALGAGLMGFALATSVDGPALMLRPLDPAFRSALFS